MTCCRSCNCQDHPGIAARRGDDALCEVVIAEFVWGAMACNSPAVATAEDEDGYRHPVCDRHREQLS